MFLEKETNYIYVYITFFFLIEHILGYPWSSIKKFKSSTNQQELGDTLEPIWRQISQLQI